MVTVQPIFPEKSNVKNKIEKATLVSIFSKLSQQTDYKFSYGQAIISDNTVYTVNYTNESVSVILSDLSKKANFNYNINGKLVLIQKTEAPKTTTHQAVDRIKVKGKIVDENKVPIPGANIMETTVHQIQQFQILMVNLKSRLEKEKQSKYLI
jgi:hypothetical protein